MNKPKFLRTYDTFSEIGRRLRADSMSYVKHVLKQEYNNELDISQQYKSIIYDGGRHPEYNANSYSKLEFVFMEDDKLYVDTEDVENYPVESLSHDDVATIAWAVYEELERLEKND